MHERFHDRQGVPLIIFAAASHIDRMFISRIKGKTDCDRQAKQYFDTTSFKTTDFSVAEKSAVTGRSV
ncbi:hypothetical protein ACTXT7_001515 [Hymenolepis weldensis]